MSENEQGRESIESSDQADGRHEQKPDATTTQGEVAGGDKTDVPGGAYNVPPGLADEVSDEPAR